jgi:hypothetical protein
VLSLEISWIQSILQPFLGSKSSLSGTPAMTLLGLKWGNKGSTLLYTVLFLVKVVADKLHTLALSEGWRNSEASSVKRILANALRISIMAVKSLSLLSYFTFVASSDNAPTLMLRMTGYRMAATNSNEATNYRPSQFFLEQRKFMWLAMIGCASAAMVSIDWNYIRRISWRQYQLVYHALHALYNRARRFLILQDSEDSSENSNSLQIAGISRPSGDTQSISLVCVRCSRNPPDNPHKSTCSHVFCYLCIAPYLSKSGRTSAGIISQGGEIEIIDDQQMCPLCNRIILDAAPWEKN